MKRSVIALLLSLGLILLGAGYGLAEEAAKAKEPAAAPAAAASADKDLMPSFSLPGMDGKAVDNESIKGKPAAFVFMQTACNLCRQEVDDMNKISAKSDYKDIGFYIVSVDINPDKVLPGYIESYKIKLPVLKDPDFTLGTKLGLSFTPAAVFVGKDGKVKAMTKGYAPGQFAEVKKNLDAIK